MERSELVGQIPRIDWDDFDAAFEWGPGEHVTILGPTGRGKTTLALELLKRRRFVVIVAAKPRDPVLEQLQRTAGYVRIDRWPSRFVLDDSQACRLLFWPKVVNVRDVAKIRDRYKEALDKIFRMGGWTVYVDEGLYATSPQFLDLRHRLEDYWQRARTQKISLVFSAQRSAYVPQLAFDQVDHIFAAKDNDRRNAERIGEMASLDRLEVRDTVQALDRYEFLYIGTRDDVQCIVRAPKPRR